MDKGIVLNFFGNRTSADKENDNDNDNVFSSPLLTIEGNVIAWGNNRFMQICNITQVWTGYIPKKKMPIKKTILLILIGLFGLFMFFRGITGKDFLTVLVGLAICGGVYWRYQIHIRQIEYYGLNVELSSGEIYSFLSDSNDFIQAAWRTVGSIMKDKRNAEKKHISLNFKNGNIVVGDGNVFGDNLGENIVVKEHSKFSENVINDNLNDKEFMTELVKSLNRLLELYNEKRPDDKYGKKDIENAIKCAENKDEDGLKDAVSKFNWFTKNLVIECLPKVVVEFLSRLFL